MVYIVISLFLSLFSSGFVLFFLLTLAKDLFKILFQDIGVFCLVYSTKLPPEKVCFLVWLNLLCRGANLLKFAVALMIFDPLLQQYRRNLKNRIFCQFTERKRTWDVKDSHLLLSAPTFTSRQLYLGELWPLNSWASDIKMEKLFIIKNAHTWLASRMSYCCLAQRWGHLYQTSCPSIYTRIYVVLFCFFPLCLLGFCF